MTLPYGDTCPNLAPQWAGEVMSSKENRMFVSDELKGLDMEIEMRKEGLSK